MNSQGNTNYFRSLFVPTHVAQLRAVGRRSVADRTVGSGHRSPLRRRLAALKRLPGGERLAALVRRVG